MNGLEYLDTCGSDGCFASNQFEREEARAFFTALEAMGAKVTIRDDDIYEDHDGPGEHYADSCYVDMSGVASLADVMALIAAQKPDDKDWTGALELWLWWD